jgi:glyoxylase-like metal-dependent hydrolase (beta-lactamase superfamily II)/rhodanese-related sulfurtransferase
MLFKQFYLNCLAHASYFIASEGEAVIVDPQRDVEQYIEEANANEVKIKYIIETHLHADFVSGHRELAARTGAEIIFGAKANAQFPHRAVNDGDEIKLGNVNLRFMETPGHTPESICVLVDGQKLLTGDTLFIGDVGRPDLAGGKGFTSEQMAAMMYDTLHEKILKLDDAIEVYPAHGAGSACGKNISSETSSTIGQQRRFNYALQPIAKEAFVKMMTTDLAAAPAYFPFDAEYNRKGAPSLNDLPKPKELTLQEILGIISSNEKPPEGGTTKLLDVRSAAEFGAGHFPNSINIGLGGQFASWAGTLIPMDAEIILIADRQEQIDEAVMRLARVGHENVRGFLKADEANADLFIPQITVDELKEKIETVSDLQVVDVRRVGEYESGHATKAINAPLSSDVASKVSHLDKSKPTAVICLGGYRSSAAASLLEQDGFTNIMNVRGGTRAWIDAGHPLETEHAATA